MTVDLWVRSGCAIGEWARTVSFIINTFTECSDRGDRIQLRGHKMTKANRLNGGW